jgi:hypothetical protein
VKEDFMKRMSLTVPELALIAGTRAALGAGIALLVAERLSPEQRRAIGWTLLAVGAISTGPIAMEVVGKIRESSRARVAQPEGVVEGDVT